MSQHPPALSRALRRFKSLPPRHDQTWQGGVLPLPAWIDQGPDRPPKRGWGAVWVARPSGIMNMTLAKSELTDSHELALRTLVDLGVRDQHLLHGRPGRIEVSDPELGQFLEEVLEDPSLHIAVVERLDDVNNVLREFVRWTAKDAPPGLIDSPGVTLDGIRGFADAARRFYQAAPWQYLTDEDLIEIESEVPSDRLRCCVVMGNAGVQYGLAFYGSADEHRRVSNGEQDPLLRKPYYSVTFDGPHFLPFADLLLWEDHDLPVAGPRAYPGAYEFLPGGKVERPDGKQLAFFERMLGALAETSEEEIDSGRWRRVVSASDGSHEVTLALPGVLDPVDLKKGELRPIADRRATERLNAEIARFMESQSFETLEEVNRAIGARFSGTRMDEIRSTAATPLEKAQDIMYQAFDVRGRRRVILARQALALSPDCADAYVVLAEQAAGPERALPFYEQGVAAGERALGPKVFAEDVGNFWGILDTRPYMRARFGLARTLLALGRADEAIGHLRDVLRLNPNDNQGARYVLLNKLLREQRVDDAQALIDRYRGDIDAQWRYGRALWLFQHEGDSPKAGVALHRAHERNPFVPGYLLHPDRLSAPTPEAYAIGSDEEAFICALAQGTAWQATPGALEWLERRTPSRRKKGSTRGARRRGKTRRTE
jgi:tetratricopeptide (TPR) repeat protein